MISRRNFLGLLAALGLAPEKLLSLPVRAGAALPEPVVEAAVEAAALPDPVFVSINGIDLTQYAKEVELSQRQNVVTFTNDHGFCEAVPGLRDAELILTMLIPHPEIPGLRDEELTVEFRMRSARVSRDNPSFSFQARCVSISTGVKRPYGDLETDLRLCGVSDVERTPQ